MNEKKQESRILERSKSTNIAESSKKQSFFSLKNLKAKSSLKKVGRSRTQKGHKNY